MQGLPELECVRSHAGRRGNDQRPTERVVNVRVRARDSLIKPVRIR